MPPRLVAEKGGRILHCDVTLICERPKIGPHREAMRAASPKFWDSMSESVSVKATTTEGMGYTGRARRPGGPGRGHGAAS